MLRKVLFRRYTSLKYADYEVNTPVGMGSYTEFIYDGVFHEWVTMVNGGEGTPTTTLVCGIIELSDGTIELVNHYDLKFINLRGHKRVSTGKI